MILFPAIDLKDGKLPSPFCPQASTVAEGSGSPGLPGSCWASTREVLPLAGKATGKESPWGS